MEEQLATILSQVSEKLVQMETTITLRFRESEKTLTGLNSTMTKIDEKLDVNTGMTKEHAIKIKALEDRVKKLESYCNWLVVTVVGAVILGILSKVLGI